MILADQKNGLAYLRDLVRYHVSGQLKIAPEHSEASVLALMGKPGSEILLQFRNLFMKLTREEGLNQFLTYYIIAAHPGCRMEDMHNLKKFCQQNLKILPRQVQIFTPTPSTFSTLMYWTGREFSSGKDCFVEKTVSGREKQKSVLTTKARPGKK